MKKLLLSLLLSVVTFSLWAENNNVYSVVNEGKTIWYETISENECMVVSPPEGSSYSDVISIPNTVSIEGKDYKVTKIGQFAFSNSTVTSVSLPKNVGGIDVGGFYHCEDLEYVNFENVSWFGECAFEGCSSLKGFSSEKIEIEINENTDWIRERTFQGCSSITKVKLPEDKWLKKIDSFAFQDCQKLEEINIPSTVEIIENAAFKNCGALTKIVIPEGVTAIRTNTFNGCGKLSSVTIPGSVTEIGLYAFGWTGLTSVNIPGSVKNIVEKAFMGCDKLETVTIREGVTKLGDGIFMGCEKLKSISLPNSVNKIGWGIFSGCSDLGSVVLSENIDFIPGEAFNGCGRLSVISIPEAVKTIDNSAFQNCTSLAEITLPKNINWIGDYAFAGCSSLAKVTSLNVTPPEIQENTFSGIKNDAIVYIPRNKGANENYKSDSQWSKFDRKLLPIINTLYSGLLDDIVEIESDGELYTAGDLLDGYSGTNALVFSTAIVNSADEIKEIPTNVIALTNDGRYVANEIVLTDQKPFYCPVDVEVNKLTYNRNFKDTYWQALYLPFRLKYNDWSEKVDVAYFNNIHQYDRDGDNIPEVLNIEYYLKRDGMLEPNVPYIIRAKQIGTISLTTVATEDKPVILYKSVEDGSVDCMSTSSFYKIAGFYQTKTDLYEKDQYAISGGGFKKSAKPGITVPPFKVYLNVDERSDSRLISKTQSIEIVVDGDIAEVEDFVESPKVIYNFNGVRVNNAEKSGLYIVNGKKVIVK